MPNGLPFSRRAFDTAEDGTLTVVTEATTLNPSQRNCDVLLPDASANTYAITLPPVSQCNGLRFVFLARLSATHNDGQVTVQDQDDNWLTNLTTDGMSAAGDYLIIDNIAGKFWLTVGDVTT